MGLNMLLDTAIGAVALLSDIFDIAFKPNMRNAYRSAPGMEPPPLQEG